MPKIKNLECSRCKETLSAETPQNLCLKCKGALYVRYDLKHLHDIAALGCGATAPCCPT